MAHSTREVAVENQLPPDSAEPVFESAPRIPPSPLSIPAPIPPAPDPVTYRDRGTELVIFGVGQIILGLLAALMVPFVILGAFMSRLAPGGALPPRQYVSGVATYAFVAAVLVMLGIGSVQMKRWARALTVVTSWYWLIAGSFGVVMLTAVLPVTMRRAMTQAQQTTSAPPVDMTTGVMAVIITLVIVVFTFFLILVPIAFLIFYRRSDVEMTCRYRDPVERWTDRAPLPVLGASVAFFAGSIYNLMLGLTTPMFPLFSHYLTGIPATGCLVVLAALDLYLATALFRLQPIAWWIAIFATPVRMLAIATSYSKAGLIQAYSKLGWSDAQMQMLNSSPIFQSRIVLWWGVLFMLAFLGYLLWLQRYFKTPAASVTADALNAKPL